MMTTRDTLVTLSRFYTAAEFRVDCRLNPGRKHGEPFAVLDLGPVSYHPSAATLREIAGKIDRFLASPDGAALAAIEEGRATGLADARGAASRELAAAVG